MRNKRFVKNRKKPNIQLKYNCTCVKCFKKDVVMFIFEENYIKRVDEGYGYCLECFENEYKKQNTAYKMSVNTYMDLFS